MNSTIYGWSNRLTLVIHTEIIKIRNANKLMLISGKFLANKAGNYYYLNVSRISWIEHVFVCSKFLVILSSSLMCNEIKPKYKKRNFLLILKHCVFGLSPSRYKSEWNKGDHD